MLLVETGRLFAGYHSGMNHLDSQSTGLRAILACAQILVRSGEIQGIAVVVSQNGEPPVFCQTGSVDQLTTRHARYLNEQLFSIGSDRWHLEPTNEILWPDAQSPCQSSASHCGFRGLTLAENIRVTLFIAHAEAGSLARALGVLVNHFSLVVRSIVSSHWVKPIAKGEASVADSITDTTNLPAISNAIAAGKLFQYVRQVGEAIDDIVIALDAQGLIVFSNGSARRWLTELGFAKLAEANEQNTVRDPLVSLICAEDIQMFMQRFSHALVNSTEAVAQINWRDETTGLSIETETLLHAIPDQLLQLSPGISAARILLFIKPKLSKLAVAAHYSRQHDAVTGLMNQAVLEDNLVRSLLDQNDQLSVALVFLDIGGFEIVNHLYGSAGGDAVLAELARRIELAFPNASMLARLRGCRFAAIFEGVFDQTVAYDLGQKLVACLDTPFIVEGVSVQLRGSCGTALSSSKLQTSQAMIRACEHAVFESNTQHSGSTVVFNEELSASMQMRELLSKSILGATQRGEIEIYYQPIYALRDQAIIGAEALVRWNHPTLGMIQPSDFISIAESTGIILELDEWILCNACMQGAKWATLAQSEFRIGVNVSKNQFSAPGFVDAVRGALDRSGLPANQLTIEFTEAALEATGSSGMLVMESLQAMGVGMTLDDFGVGGASLMHLLDFNLDRIKLDRKFVAKVPHEERGSALVLSILNMCLILNICVTAEGIETEEQLKYLFEMGCFEGQGYHFSPPLPVSRFGQLLTQNQVSRAIPA